MNKFACAYVKCSSFGTSKSFGYSIRRYSLRDIKACWHFVPCRMEMVEKTLQRQLSPNVFVPDLEDSIPDTTEHKLAARSVLKSTLSQFLALRPRIATVPRVNAIGTPYFDEDIETAVIPGVFGISVGKIDTMESLEHVSHVLDARERRIGIPMGTTKIIPWIEIAKGISNAYHILDVNPKISNRVFAAAFGADDFLRDMNLERVTVPEGGNREKEILKSDVESLIRHANFQLSIACRAHHIHALETPYANIKATEQEIRFVAERAKHIGYQGMFSIHPSQIKPIQDIFGISKERIEYARQVVDAYEAAKSQGKGSTSLNGVMIDAPVYRRNKELLLSYSDIGPS